MNIDDLRQGRAQLKITREYLGVQIEKHSKAVQCLEQEIADIDDGVARIDEALDERPS